MTLKELRESKGLTRRQVSDVTGISLRSLQDYEQGHKAIASAKGETIYHLSLALGCSMEEILLCESQIQMEFVKVSEEARQQRLRAYYEKAATISGISSEDSQEPLIANDDYESQVDFSTSEDRQGFDYFQNAEHITRADVEAVVLFSRTYQVYARWLFVNGECFLVFMYDGERVLLPFRVIFNEKRMPWLPDMAEMKLDSFIEECEYHKQFDLGEGDNYL